jgi:hypothetical protein
MAARSDFPVKLNLAATDLPQKLQRKSAYCTLCGKLLFWVGKLKCFGVYPGGCCHGVNVTVCTVGFSQKRDILALVNIYQSVVCRMY